MTNFYKRRENWKLYFDNCNFNRYFIFSKPWNERWQLLWEQYDTLEAERIQLGHERADWQQRREEVRDGYTEMERLHKTKWQDSDWKKCPLGYRLQFFLKTPVNRECDWRIALELWEEMRRRLRDEEHRQELWSTLSETQRVSYQLLDDWWDARYQSVALTNAAKEAIEEATRKITDYRLGGKEDELKPAAKVHQSLYHSWMFALFQREFLPSEWQPYMKNVEMMVLNLTRSRCFSQALSQSVSYSFYGHSHLASPPLMRSEAIRYPLNYRNPSLWLAAVDKARDKPYHLWDVHNECTVLTKDLVPLPEYTCIRHTWGRWRMGSITVPGVPWLVPQNSRFDVLQLTQSLKSIGSSFVWLDLFCIPQDSSDPFLKAKAVEEIGRQASIFRSASRCLAWINDAPSWNGIERALEWLSALFLNNTTLSGVYDTERWLDDSHHGASVPAELMKPPENLNQIIEELRDSAAAAGGSLDYLESEVVDRGLGSSPTDWFSSLWTLQEAALCSDLCFMTRDWEPLLDGRGEPLPLHVLFIFINNVSRFGRYKAAFEQSMSNPQAYESEYIRSPEYLADEFHNTWPRGPFDLTNLVAMTRMDYMFGAPTPEWLLILANMRQSTDSRAPAIMSALGATEWYTKRARTKSLLTGEHLMFDMYPLDFVREAAQKVGAAFYLADPVVRRKSSTDYFEPHEKGTMMPFAKPQGWFSSRTGVVEYTGLDRRDHPTIGSWKINADGSVLIGSAVIIASSGQLCTHDFRGSSVYLAGRNGPTNEIPNIRTWLEDVPQKYVVYMVTLFTDSGFQHGLALCGKRSQWSRTKHLAKIGTYFMQSVTLPEAQAVDWKVR